MLSYTAYPEFLDEVDVHLIDVFAPVRAFGYQSSVNQDTQHIKQNGEQLTVIKTLKSLLLQ